MEQIPDTIKYAVHHNRANSQFRYNYLVTPISQAIVSSLVKFDPLAFYINLNWIYTAQALPYE